MDRRPNVYPGVRPNVRGVENVGNVGSPAFSQHSGTGRAEYSSVNSSRGGSRRRNRQKSRNQAYFSDHLLLTRMKQYLEQNTECVEVDFDHMADYFRSRFRDYANRKNDALKGLLVRGHDAIMAEFEANADYTAQLPPLLSGTPDPDSEDYPDDDNGSFNDSVNQSNMQLMSMYNANSNRRQSQRARNEDDPEELINISSSDEGSNEAKKMRPAPKDDQDQSFRDETKQIPPLLPPHILSVIRKADTEVFPAVSYNGGALHPNAMKSALATVTSQNANDAFAASRKRKAGAAVDPRKPVSGPSKKKREVAAVSPTVTFKDFGGNARVLSEVCKLLVHMRHPEVYRQIGVSPPRGFLLHGPPGCGKTLLAHAIAGELQVPLIKVASPELVAGVSGESEERVRDLFAQAAAAAPCVLFLDEVDAVTPNRHTAQREMERRIVAQLLSSLDELGQEECGDQVLVIGATNRPDSIDPALRRAGRFDREVCLGIPDLDARRQILKVLCGKLRLAADLSFDDIARNTPGYVGADLMALTREAAMAAVNRVFGELKHAAAAAVVVKATAPEERSGDADEVILVHDEPKAKAEENDNKDVVVDVDVEDAAKGAVNGKPKKDDKPDNQSDDKMDVCEVVGDNSDCIVLDETPEESAGNKEAEVKGKEEGAKEDDKGKAVTDKEETSKEKEKAKPEVEEQKSKETMVTDKKDQEKTTKAVEADKEGTKDSENEASAPESKEEPMELETIAETSAPKPAAGAGPDLAELISWLHDVAPLTPAQLDLLHVERRDFELALKAVQPSAKREGFATVPDVTWDDVGALADIRDELQMAILAPVKHAEQFAALGLTTPTGVLLCGPPGCGKTFLAKAVANEAGINFISVKGPELLNMYVGESERAVRQCFQRARNSAPCVIFFDELDALCPKRSDSGEGGASMRVVNQMLTEMDGVEGRKDVYLMAATNRPDIVDPAVLRPGRLDKILYVGMPSGPDRVLILQALTKSGSKPTLCADVSLSRLGECSQTDGYTGADLAALVREAAMQALREHLVAGEDSALAVADKHFNLALAKIRPSVSEKDRKYYEKLREVYTAVPSAKSG